jgi:cytochrome c556
MQICGSRFMSRVRHVTVALTMGFSIAATTSAQVAAPVGPQLPEALRGLLQQEMIAIRHASYQILDALVMGQDEIVAARAQDIHDSFIMEQNLTEADRQTLKRTLPSGFVALDQSFHALAAALAAAGRRGDRPEQQAQFARLVETCAACHGRFATDRFPAFARD